MDSLGLGGGQKFDSVCNQIDDSTLVLRRSVSHISNY